MARRNSTLPDPQDVLRGGTRASIEQLFALVHQVNPTDRGLDPDEEQRRYALKSALQSLLIRQHGQALQVAGEGEVISLRHVHGQRDACHALLSQLDEDARAWVRARQADQAGLVPSAPLPDLAPIPPGPSTQDDLARGRAALDAWDFEAAEASFRRALGSRPADAAVDLLELLVDHLARDEDALALELPEQVQQLPPVRRLLVTAAVRLERDDQALELAEGLDSPALVPALATLAGRFLARGAHQRGAALLHRLRGLDPAHPALVELDDALQAARAAARRPAEEALLALEQASDWPALAAAAQAVLEDWPDSSRASQLLQQARRQLDLAEAGQLAARARDADPDEALRLLRRARELGLEVGPAIARARRAANEAERTRRVTLVRQALDRDLAEGLRTALDLERRDRHRLSDPHLDQLWTVLDARRSRRPEQAVDALLALYSAQTASQQAEWQATIELLEAHRDWLRPLAEARELYDQAVEARDQSRRLLAQAQLEALDQAVEAGHFDQAQALLLDLEADSLDSASRTRLTLLRQTVQVATRQARWETTISRLLQRERLVEARNQAAEYGRQDPTWQARHAELAHQVVETLELQLHDPSPQGLDLRDFKTSMPAFGPDLSLRPGGRELITAELHHRLVVVRALDVHSGRILRAFRLVLPWADGCAHCVVDHGVLWVLSERTALALDPDTGQVQSLVQLPPQRLDGETIAGVRVVPGTDCLWLTLRRDKGRRSVVMNARTGQVLRRLERVGVACPLVGEHKHLVASYTGKNLGFHSPEGELGNTAGARERGIQDIALAPEGDAFVALLPDDRNHPTCPVLLRVDFRTGRGHSVLVPGVGWRPGAMRLVTDRRLGRVYVNVMASFGTSVVALAGPRLDECWRVKVPVPMFVMSDAEGLHAALFANGDRGHTVVPLGRDRPDLMQLRGWGDIAPKDMNPHAHVLKQTPHPPGEGPRPRAMAFLEALTWGQDCLGRGHLRPALQALDEPVVWQCFELQSRARLARAWQATTPRSPAEALRRELAMAGYVALAQGTTRYGTKNVGRWQHAWEMDTLKQVAEEIRRDLFREE